MRVHAWSDGFLAEAGGAWAFVAREEAGRLLARDAASVSNVPSHVAEWMAVSRALAWAEATLAPGDHLEVRVDSALVAKGLASRRPEMSGEAAELRASCRQALARLAKNGIKANVVRIPREKNREADELAREAAHRR